ncbi:outer membrane beta-barrel protein [Tenacibaculum sp. M341]|uniref:outer membrane beta-barrel protein n=1 Tax=Tenacibaculum sp. M341 TaxID=2530339 RepID=UPI0010457B68|nr:outer membrane beta-barrel family protein [Tenacibaculum sp. M341]TCI94276.1 TonB-dependent receptor [Tenacibaculum sp. M341]
MKILKLLSICLFIYTNISYAQYSISGTVTDAQKEALPFANIILYEKGKESTPKGVVSDDNGTYSFNNLKKGTYKIEVSMLGFTKETIQFFDLTSNKTFNLILKEQNQSLDEVVVKSKRPVIKQTAEKLVLNLENSELLSNNLQDVVKSIPGVIVTNNGISFAGRSDIRILINGKTTDYMDTDALLRDLPADNIAKVEFIEQPGAEFDAEGSGPIINIILKKNVRIGMHGNVGVWVGEDEGFEYGTSASIANYKNKLNWQLNAGYSSPTWRNDLFIEREVQETTYDQATREPYSPKNIWTGGSLDYYLNDKISVGFNTRYRNTVSDRIATARTIVTTPTTVENIFSDNTFERDRNTFNLNPYFEYKTEKEKFIVDFNYIDFQDGNMNTIYPVAGNTNDFAEQRYFQNGEFTIKTTKVDYTKNLSDKVKLSVGSKYSDIDTDSDLKLFVANNVGDFEFQSGGSNRFLIDENIFAVYSKINATLGKWSFSGGLRYENSETKGTSTNTNETRERKISQLFPSFSVSRKLTEQLGANFAYSYRIRRPNYNSLNSFVTLYDPLTSEVGNPSLNPAFTNNYQFNLTFDSQPFFTVGYSDTKDNLFLFISQDDTTAQISRTTINLQDRENWNFRFFGPLDFIEGLEGFSGITVNYNNFRSNELNPVLELSKWSYGWYTQASYKLPWNINAEMSSYLGSGILEGQIDSGWIGDLSFSFGKKFMDDRLKVNLGIYKVLDRGFVGRVNYDNINANIESNGSRQNVQLRLTYSFGSRFGKKKEKRNSSRDEENRIQDND